MSAMQNKPKSNFYSSQDFTATTIDAFKLTGKSLRLIDFNSISFLRGNWNWDLRIQQSFKSTLQMLSTSLYFYYCDKKFYEHQILKEICHFNHFILSRGPIVHFSWQNYKEPCKWPVSQPRSTYFNRLL